MPFPFSKPHVMVASKLVEDPDLITSKDLKPSSNARDEEFMELALEQARVAASRGEVPVGAVLVREDQILAVGHNNREERQNPTAHAEISVIEQGASQLGTWRLSETILYVTLEPCLMCVGAIIQARIPRLVFGAKLFSSLLNGRDFCVSRGILLLLSIIVPHRKDMVLTHQHRPDGYFPS